MERSVVVGGLLISASLLLALLFNRSELEERALQKPAPAPAAREAPENCGKAPALEADLCGCAATACPYPNDSNGHEAAAGCSASAAPCDCPCSSRSGDRSGGPRLHP